DPSTRTIQQPTLKCRPQVGITHAKQTPLPELSEHGVWRSCRAARQPVLDRPAGPGRTEPAHRPSPAAHHCQRTDPDGLFGLHVYSLATGSRSLCPAPAHTVCLLLGAGPDPVRCLADRLWPMDDELHFNHRIELKEDFPIRNHGLTPA